MITYSPKYAAYQKEIREKQIERAKQCFQMAGIRKTGKNRMTQPRFIDKQLLQRRRRNKPDILYFLDEEKIAQETQYDGLYAYVRIFDDEPENILKVSESRWQIESKNLVNNLEKNHKSLSCMIQKKTI